MKFLIERNSTITTNNKPTPSAKRVILPVNLPDTSISSLSCWYVELDNIQDLLKLLDVEGNIIILSNTNLKFKSDFKHTIIINDIEY